MNTITAYFFDNRKQTKEVGWFKNALYLFLIYKVFIYVFHFTDFFSATAIIYNSPKRVGFIVDLAYLLTTNFSTSLSIVFITLVFSISVIELLKKGNTLLRIVLWLLIINLNNYLYPTLTGGDYLLNQLLFFNIFLNYSQSKNKFIADVCICLYNGALAGIKIQVCLVYFCSALFKLTDADWLNGSALHHIFLIPEYSNSFLLSLPAWVCLALTYTTLCYQLLFPLLIWNRFFKPYLFVFGILQHLTIACCMGLFGFGIIMMLCYLLFLKYDDRIVENQNLSY